MERMTTGDCLDLMLAAGFDNFETHIPVVNEHSNYVLTLWHHGGDPWKAHVEDDMSDYETMATGEGATPLEALWNLTLPVGDSKPFSGDAAAIPGRIKALGARLWAEATRKVAMDEACAAVSAMLKAKDSGLRYTNARMLAENAASMAELPPLKFEETDELVKRIVADTDEFEQGL
jgi:hypothetical protein